MISFSIYRRFTAVYIVVSVVCIAIGAVVVTRNPGKEILLFAALIAILFITIFILMKIANKKFQAEVVSHLHNCNVGFYIEELTKLLGTRRDKVDQSVYACLSSVGYEVLGDYDSLYASCQNIKLKIHMPIYHRRMFSYYFNNKEPEYAKAEADTLAALASKEHLLFASSKGGDTKYKRHADELLEKIG